MLIKKNSVIFDFQQFFLCIWYYSQFKKNKKKRSFFNYNIKISKWLKKQISKVYNEYLKKIFAWPCNWEKLLIVIEQFRLQGNSKKSNLQRGQRGDLPNLT